MTSINVNDQGKVELIRVLLGCATRGSRNLHARTFCCHSRGHEMCTMAGRRGINQCIVEHFKTEKQHYLMCLSLFTAFAFFLPLPDFGTYTTAYRRFKKRDARRRCAHDNGNPCTKGKDGLIVHPSTFLSHSPVPCTQNNI